METLLYKSNPWWEEKYHFDGIYRDKYLEKLELFLKNRDIVFLTGLRRVGKTSIMKNFIDILINSKQINPKNILYISLDFYLLDDYSMHEIITTYRKLHKLSTKEKLYLFFDEVTAKQNYQIELKNLYDLEDVKVFASSSSASLLKDKNAYLTGRSRVLEVMPLDFDEYLMFKNIVIKKADDYLKESYFEEYMQDGGMPEYVLTSDITYLQNLIDNIITKDIISHYNLKNKQVVKDFYKLLMERAGKQLSLNKIANILDISVDSAKRYLHYFEEVYLIYSIKKHGKLNERLKNPSKIYSCDIGLKNIMTGFRDKGAIFENIVFLEIKDKNPTYIYVDGIEIDFITEDGIMIEAKYHSKLNEKQKLLFEKYQAKKKYVIDGYKSLEKFLENSL